MTRNPCIIIPNLLFLFSDVSSDFCRIHDNYGRPGGPTSARRSEVCEPYRGYILLRCRQIPPTRILSIIIVIIALIIVIIRNKWKLQTYFLILIGSHNVNQVISHIKLFSIIFHNLSCELVTLAHSFSFTQCTC